MGHGEYRNITVSMNKDQEKYVRQVMDCLFPKKAECGAEDSILKGFPYCDWSQEDGKVDGYELFQLMNTLFGSTYVYTEEGEYHTVSDYYKRDEEIYDPVRMEKRYAGYEVCYGEVDDDAYFQAIDREELRQRLQEEDLYDDLNKIAEKDAKDGDYFSDWSEWREECYADEPNDIVLWVLYNLEALSLYDLFYEEDCMGDLRDPFWNILMELLDEVEKDEPGDRYEGSKPIQMEEADQEIIDILIQAAIEKGNTELLALILEKTKKV